MHQSERITFEQFKQTLSEFYGEHSFRLREEGKHGWTSFDVGEDGKLVFHEGQSGPHWVDACPIGPDPRVQGKKNAGLLLGTYSHTRGEATFYNVAYPIRTRQP